MLSLSTPARGLARRLLWSPQLRRMLQQAEDRLHARKSLPCPTLLPSSNRAAPAVAESAEARGAQSGGSGRRCRAAGRSAAAQSSLQRS